MTCSNITLRSYQRRAKATDQRPIDGNQADERSDDDAFVIPLLGIGGELGTLQAEYKKYLRDGEEYRPFRDHICEELGDILWYVANLATKFDLDLTDIAEDNLAKIEDRFAKVARGVRIEADLLDASARPRQRLPRRFAIEFRPVEAPDRPEPVIQGSWRAKPWGDPLGDNAYDDDGYRFHDVFHLAHAAVLGWSPVCRRPKQFNCKRRADATTNAVEDGGRAIVTEEAIVAYVYGHARDHGWFERVNAVDFAVLKTIKGLTADLEVSSTPLRNWERAILEGYRVWRDVWRNNGGVVIGDLFAGTIDYRPAAD